MATMTSPQEPEPTSPPEARSASPARDSRGSLIERSDIARAILLMGGLVLMFSGWQLLASRRPASTDTIARPLNFQVDFNTAPASELSLLPGIGPEMARRIIADRESRGPFRMLDDLSRVRGIGPKTIRQIESMARFSDSPPTGHPK
jgi:competence ComEA-like helix-hairpin-helix protein